MKFYNPIIPPVEILKYDKFGYRWGRLHGGVDLRPDSDNIHASHGGTVTISARDQHGGLYIDVTNGNQMTRYLHNRANLVRVGDKVKAGQLIGYIGNTGLSTGRHLHFETWINGQRVNPELHVDFTSQPYKEPRKPPAPKPKPEPKPQPEPKPEPQARTYTVKAGDSLWVIAQKELGSGSRWGEIYSLNKDIISNPDLIYPGQVFKLP